MPKPFAEWNPNRGLWETWEVDMFSGLSEPYSETWPISGMTRNGRAFALPTSVLHIGESESSSSRILPTPTATPYGNNQSPSPGAAVRPSLDGIARTLPTPRASDIEASMTAPADQQHVTDGNGSLAEVLGATLLPTPTARDHKGRANPPTRKNPRPPGNDTLPDAVAKLRR